MIPIHPRLKLWLDLGDALAVAAETGARRVHHALHRRSQAVGRTRRPGSATPMWNVCTTLLRQELQIYGSKARLARYLGVPRQRINDFLTGRRRLPDAELTLRLLHWLAECRAGRNLAL